MSLEAVEMAQAVPSQQASDTFPSASKRRKTSISSIQLTDEEWVETYPSPPGLSL